MANQTKETDQAASAAAGVMPHTEGHRAYHSGKSKDECPYDYNTVDAIDWKLGWEDAAAGIPEGR